MNNKFFDIEFKKECGKILNELYHNPIELGDVKLKRIVIKAEKIYIDYLLELNLITDLKTATGAEFGIQLERKGFEVFEKYDGWNDYIVKVIDRQLKINKAKDLAVRFWWIPITISVLSLSIAILSLILKVKK